MGMPAARVGDLVTHIAPPILGPGPGSSNVLIGGMPAWRALPAGAAAAMPPPTTEPPPEPELTEEEQEEEDKLTEEEKEERDKEAAAEQQAEAEAAIASMGGAADIHICAQPSPVPFCVDGPGFVIKGSSTVMINGLPAARQGDIVQEVLGPPNPIAMGCPTVLIGG
ncbi:MAG: PAAR domain-containing protein [Cyanobacteria bacterium P01_F01_bin.150]